MYQFIFYVLLTAVKSQEVATPSSLLGPKYFNYHAYIPGGYRQGLKIPVPTKQGPVLFPNDGPAPPKPPLVVTTRPLLEAIANSDLNLPYNDTTSSDAIPLKPYLERYKNFKKSYAARIGIGDSGKVSYDEINDQNYSNEQTNEIPDESTSENNPVYELLDIHKLIPKRDKSKLVTMTGFTLMYYGRDPDGDSFGEENYPDETTTDSYNNSMSTNAVRTKISCATGHVGHGTQDTSAMKRNYAFAYTVKDKDTGDDFSHSQKSSGSATNGEYRVRLPDGRMQIVSYTADENGYKAEVRYDEEKPNIINNYKDYNVNPDLQNDYGVNNNNIHNGNAKYDYGDNNYDTDNKINNNYVGNNNNIDKINAKYDYGDSNYDAGQVNNDYRVNSNYIHNNIAKYEYDDNNYDSNSKITNDYDVNNVNARIFKHKDYNSYNSEEYFNEDYSSEFNGNYPPYQSKFSKLLISDKLDLSNFRNVQKSTVSPSYSNIKSFVTKDLYETQKYDNLVYLNGLSTPTFSNYEATTENIVIIGTKPSLLKQNIPEFVTPTVATSPRNYLVSTIASLKNRIVQPVLSGRFIDKINKYLTFN